MPPPDATTTDARHIGRYLLQEEVGRGGMGVVHAAWDATLERRVALKLLRFTGPAQDGAAAGRFAQEMRIALTLEHPNIVPVYETGEEQGVHYIAMRLVEGEDLGAVIRREAAAGHGLIPGRVARIGRQLAAALDAAHARGLVHRDVKPGNVLLTGAGDEEHVYLTDFGLTREADGGVTQTGHWVGTVDYAAPEQIEAGVIGPRTDIYALGCVLFHALTGRLPFVGTFAAKATAHVTAPLPTVGAAVVPDPSRIDAVLAMATAKDPARRHASAGALARAFARAVADSVADAGQRTVAMAPVVLGDADALGAEAADEVVDADADADADAGADAVTATQGAGAVDAAGGETLVGPRPAVAPRSPRVRARASDVRPSPPGQREADVGATRVRPASSPPQPGTEERTFDDAGPPAGAQRGARSRAPAVLAGLLALLLLGGLLALVTGGKDAPRRAGGTAGAAATSGTSSSASTGSTSASTGSSSASTPKPAPAPARALPTTPYAAPRGGYTAQVPAGWTRQDEQDLTGVLRSIFTGPDGQQLWIDATPAMPPAFGRNGRTVTQVRTLDGPLGAVVGYRFTGIPTDFCGGGCVDYQLDLGGHGYAVIAGPTPAARLAARTAMMSLKPTAAAATPATTTPAASTPPATTSATPPAASTATPPAPAGGGKPRKFKHVKPGNGNGNGNGYGGGGEG